MDFNGAGVRAVPAFNFNNLTISNTRGVNAVTLVNGGPSALRYIHTRHKYLCDYQQHDELQRGGCANGPGL